MPGRAVLIGVESNASPLISYPWLDDGAAYIVNAGLEI